MPPDDTLSSTDIETLFRFDPFAEDSSEGETPTGDQASSEVPSEGQAESTEPGSADHQPSTAQEPEGASSASGESTPPDPTQQLREERDSLAERVARLEGALQATQQPQQAPKGAGGEESDGFETPPFNFDIPDQVVDMLDGSREERKRALAALLQGTAQNVYKTARRDIEKALPERVQQTTQATSMREREADTIRQDFFGKFPELQREELMPLIAQVVNQTTQETGQRHWNEKLRDAVGQKVKQILGSVAPQGANGASNGGGPKAPAAQRSGNARPPMQTDSEQADIMRTIFG